MGGDQRAVSAAVRRWDAGTVRRGLVGGVAASLMLMGAVGTATSVRAVERVPTLVLWVAVTLSAVGAWGVLAGRRRWVVSALMVPVLLWAATVGSDSGVFSAVPAVGPVPVSVMVVLAGTVAAGWTVSAWAVSPTWVDVAAVTVVGVAGLVLVDPVVVAVGTVVAAGVLSLRWPGFGVAGLVVMSVVGLWLGSVWLVSPDRVWPPPVMTAVGLVAGAFSVGLGRWAAGTETAEPRR